MHLKKVKIRVRPVFFAPRSELVAFVDDFELATSLAALIGGEKQQETHS